MSDFFDFNTAGSNLIPDNTLCAVQMDINKGDVGDDGYLTDAKKGGSKHVACVFTVLDGPYTGYKIYVSYTVQGTTPGHETAKRMSRDTFRQMVESARGIKPSDESETAHKARTVSGFQDLDGLRFLVRVGVRPPENGFKAKNIIQEIITPDDGDWKQLEQVGLTPSGASSSSTTSNVIARPDWAK